MEANTVLIAKIRRPGAYPLGTGASSITNPG